MKKRTLRKILIFLLSFIVVGCVAVVGITGYMVFANTTQLSTNEETALDESPVYFDNVGFDYASFLARYPMEQHAITSSVDGHTIPADLIMSGERDAATVIMIHGLGGNRQTVLPEAELFLRQGYNVLAYDQRSAGENTASHTTFGYLESADAADCVAFLDGIISPENHIYLWGVSNGAATAGIAARHDIVRTRVSAIVLDCPISSTEDMIRLAMSEMDAGIPLAFAVFSGNLVNRVALGFSYGEASVVAQLPESSIPALIIASRAIHKKATTMS